MSALLCSYTSLNGTTTIIQCPEMCCSGNVHTEDEACCERESFTGIYIAATVGSVCLLGIVFACLACICLKEKLFRTTGAGYLASTYTPTQRWTSASASIDLTITVSPPAYSTLDFPPPYVQVIDQSKSHASSTTTMKSSFPERPPPPYSENVDNHD